MRQFWTRIHRWAGLFIALFLIIAGLTGALISWDHEIDEWLNQDLFEVSSRGEYRPPLALAATIEEAYPQAHVSFVPLGFEVGHAAAFGVEPRIDPATGKRYSIDYNQVFIDPVSGEIRGVREWGAVSLSRENLMPFLYKLHYSLHVPEMWGTDRWGVWFMGIVAMVWLVDCFVGFYLTLPRRQRLRATSSGASWWQCWQPAWRVRWRSGGYKLNFDLHRAGALWVWGVLFILAFTSFSLNLYREVFYPVMSQLSQVTPGPFETRTPTSPDQPIASVMSYAGIINQARSEAVTRGWPEPAGSVFHSGEFGVYGVSFFFPGGDHGSGGMGVKTLYLDSQDGHLIGDKVPWQGTAADVFVQLQFPLHSGRILGLPGRILMSVMGLMVAMLSITGIIIWLRKRRARLLAAERYLTSSLADGERA